MTLLNKLSVFCLLLVTLIACNSDDPINIIDDVIDDPSEGKLTATIDGSNFSALDDSLTAQLVLITINGSEAYFISIGGASIDGSLVQGLGFSFGDGDINGLVAGKTHQGISNDTGLQYALGTYQEEGSNELTATSEGTDNARVTVTSINMTDKTISGEFSFTGIDEDTGESHNITNGVFTDITYTED